MTEEEVFSTLKTDLERAEFKCALNLYNFAYLAVTTYYTKVNAKKDPQDTILSTGVFASVYAANLRWYGTILREKYGRAVGEDEIAERWKKYYARLVETGLRPGMTYDNGLRKDAPLSFDGFHSGIIKWHKSVLLIYAEQKKAMEEKK